MTETAPPAAAPAPGRRGNQTVGNILRSLLPLVALVLLAVWLLWPHAGSRVHAVDPTGDLRGAARVASYRVVSPQGLPEGWTPTSSRVDQPIESVVTVEIGYLTPGGRYARYVQSNLRTEELLAAQLPGATVDGTALVGTRTWQRYRTDRGETALVLPGPATLLVTGSAPTPDLTTLANALR